MKPSFMEYLWFMLKYAKGTTCYFQAFCNISKFLWNISYDFTLKIKPFYFFKNTLLYMSIEFLQQIFLGALLHNTLMSLIFISWLKFVVTAVVQSGHLSNQEGVSNIARNKHWYNIFCFIFMKINMQHNLFHFTVPSLCINVSSIFNID